MNEKEEKIDLLKKIREIMYVYHKSAPVIYKIDGSMRGAVIFVATGAESESLIRQMLEESNTFFTYTAHTIKSLEQLDNEDLKIMLEDIERRRKDSIQIKESMREEVRLSPRNRNRYK